MKNQYNKPDWVPRVEKAKKVLVVGASGGLGGSLVNLLIQGSECIVGAHGSSKNGNWQNDRVVLIQKTLSKEKDCLSLIDDFIVKAKQIDALVVLAGAINYSGHWLDIPEDSWKKEIEINMSIPFYLARYAMKIMIKQKSGGKIVLSGTESSLHGGSEISFPYAIAKRGTECMVQGLAREGAKNNILVNGVRLGYFKSGFHQRWHNKTDKEMEDRKNLVPLKRGGDPEEAAALITYLLSEYGNFITGQMIPVTGGDWL